MVVSKSITIIGLKEAVNDLRQASTIIKRESRRFFDSMGRYGVGRAKAYTMDAGAVDLGELVQGIHYKTSTALGRLETVIRPSDVADKYAIYVELGTRPHRPPVSALQGWADRHGIPVWAVVRKIEREGTEPRYIFRDTFADIEHKVDREIPSFAERIIRAL